MPERGAATPGLYLAFDFGLKRIGVAVGNSLLRHAQALTVIHAATLARDAFDWLNRAEGDPVDHEAALQEMEKVLLGAEIGGMIVTPREIDDLVSDAAEILARGVNRALHPGLSDQDIMLMMH